MSVWEGVHQEGAVGYGDFEHSSADAPRPQYVPDGSPISRLVVASASAKAFVESSFEYRCQAWVIACSVLAISLRSFVKILSICIGFS